MEVIVIGYTDFKQTKNGNIGCWLFYSYQDRNVNHGSACDRVWVDVNVGLPSDLKEDDIILLSFNQRGQLISCQRA